MTHKKKIPAAVRGSVWNKYIGEENGRGKCYICMGQITQGTFACGHIIAEAMGGKTVLGNLRPICTRCNSSQGTANMDEFIDKYELENSGKKEEMSLSKLSHKEIKMLIGRRRHFIKYKTQWNGLENYLCGRLFAPRKSKLRVILFKLTKKTLLCICRDFQLNCPYSKKGDIIELILSR